MDKIFEVEAKLGPVKLIFSTDTMKELAQCKNTKDLVASLESKYNFKSDMLDDMFEASRVSVSCFILNMVLSLFLNVFFCLNYLIDIIVYSYITLDY